jgi:hypothetical protein
MSWINDGLPARSPRPVFTRPQCMDLRSHPALLALRQLSRAAPPCPTTSSPLGRLHHTDIQDLRASLGACGVTPTLRLRVRVYFFFHVDRWDRADAANGLLRARRDLDQCVPVGGTPPYTFLWSTSETSDSIFRWPRHLYPFRQRYSSCPPASTSVVVRKFMPAHTRRMPRVTSIVCGDGLPCNGRQHYQAPAVASGSAAVGPFLPVSPNLNATYMPTPAELPAGSVDLSSR